VSKIILAVLAMAAMVWPSLAATRHKTAKKHSQSAVASHKPAAKTTGARKTSATATTVSTSKTARRTKSKTSKLNASVSRRRNYQQAPTADRYKEIQQALVDKGYLHSEATGTWDADSAAALKRFQADQNLTADGKLSSLSLIALGLGPKRLSAQTHTQPAGDGPKTDVPR